MGLGGRGPEGGGAAWGGTGAESLGTAGRGRGAQTSVSLPLQYVQ